MKFFPFFLLLFLNRMVDVEEDALGYRDDADAWLSGVADFPRVGGFQQDDWAFPDRQGRHRPEHAGYPRANFGHGEVDIGGGDDPDRWWHTGDGGRYGSAPDYFGNRWRSNPYGNHGDYVRGGYNRDWSLADAVSRGWSARTSIARENQNFDPRQSQNYITESVLSQWSSPTTVPSPDMMQGGSFQFPTRYDGNFGRAMSMFATTQESGLSGTGSRFISGDDNFKNVVSQALALKLNLKTQQHANEKMFRSLAGSGGHCLTLKQVVQERAAVYDEAADPS